MISRKLSALTVNDEQIDAIARGVETRLDSVLGYSEAITQETIDIARKLGIPEKRIQHWEATRASQDAERTVSILSRNN